MKKKPVSILLCLLLVLALPVPAYADYQGITIDGYYDDWEDKPHSTIYHGNDGPADYNYVSLFRDESTLYVHVEFSEAENYIFETTKMTIKTNVGNNNLWFKPDYAGGFFSEISWSDEEFWDQIDQMFSYGEDVDELIDYLFDYLLWGDGHENSKKGAAAAEEDLTETDNEVSEQEDPDRGGLFARIDEKDKKEKDKDVPTEPVVEEEAPAEEETPPADPETPAPTEEEQEAPSDSPAAEEELPLEEVPTDDATTVEDNLLDTDAAIESEEEAARTIEDLDDWVFSFPLIVTKTQGGTSSVGDGFYTIRYENEELLYDAEFAIPLSSIHMPYEGMKEIEMKIALLGKQWIICVGTSTTPFVIAGIGALMVFGTYGYVTYRKRRLASPEIKG